MLVRMCTVMATLPGCECIHRAYNLFLFCRGRGDSNSWEGGLAFKLAKTEIVAEKFPCVSNIPTFPFFPTIFLPGCS